MDYLRKLNPTTSLLAASLVPASAPQPSVLSPLSLPYRGRFAPSPTGPLHFGSLAAAVASYLQARRHGGEWLVRIEDLDVPRVVRGSADSILRTLDAYGFEWHGAVLYQSTRTDAYEHALAQLRERRLSYPCACTRSELQALPASHSDGEELFYPGLCSVAPRRSHGPYAWRFRVPHTPVEFSDELQGTHSVDLSQTLGDFVVKRRDGYFAYQLAVVVDDATQGITEVVRGADLLFNTPRQIALQHALGLPTPHALHIPIAVDAGGQKLSKSSAAPAVTAEDAGPILWQALQFLRQTPPGDLGDADVRTLWAWAFEHWQPQTLHGLRTAGVPPR